MFKKNIQGIKPFIFYKKINDNSKIIPLKKTTNTLGLMRYFPPATQEWFNSIYTFNNSYIKNITVTDTIISKLIKSYFNLYFSNKLLLNKRIITRFRRLALNKVFFSKAELKHTANKVVITLYVYNEERRILMHKIRRIEAILFPYNNNLSFEDKNNRILSLRDKLNIIKHQKESHYLKNSIEELKTLILEDIKLERDVLVTIKKEKDKKEKLLEIETLKKNLNYLLKIIYLCEKDPFYSKYYYNIYSKIFSKTILEKEIMTIAYYKLLLNLNKFKFEDNFLLKLKSLVSKIYNKEVEFNIVNLKSIYLNSDIFTQAISLKLKDRNNGLLRVLRSFLYMVKLPKVNMIRERFGYINIKELWANKVKNIRINYLIENNKKDSLNKLLLGLFNNSNYLEKLEQDNGSKFNNTTNLVNDVLNSLNYKNMGGVRLEAKGRLTKRFTASRSIFKIKWKGSIKNIDSSYKGISSVILRGYLKSNVQYSIINSKTRNGAFGLKGWTSGK